LDSEQLEDKLMKKKLIANEASQRCRLNSLIEKRSQKILEKFREKAKLVNMNK